MNQCCICHGWIMEVRYANGDATSGWFNINDSSWTCNGCHEKKQKFEKMQAKYRDDQKKKIQKANEASKKLKIFIDKTNILKQKINNLKTSPKINNTDESKSTDNVNIEDLTQLGQELQSFMGQIETELSILKDVIANSHQMMNLITKQETIESEQKLQTIQNEIKKQQDIILKGKQTVRAQLDETNEKLKNIKKKSIANSQEFIQQADDEKNMNDLNKNIEKLFIECKLNSDERDANPDAANKLHQQQDELLKTLKEKHQINNEKYEQLTKCETRIDKIRAKLMATQSNNKYVLQCLDEEYNQLRNAAKDATVKFEQRAKYFLAITLNLKEDLLNKFQEEELDEDMDGILELKDKDLEEMGIKKFVRKRILREIKKLKENSC
eukprot:461188_1